MSQRQDVANDTGACGKVKYCAGCDQEKPLTTAIDCCQRMRVKGVS
jgi:hypothetical protein